MFVLKNAARNVTRNKGRNILIIIIVAIIAIAATVGLAILQAAQRARADGLANTTITAQIAMDRGSMMKKMEPPSTNESGSDSKPDFDAMRNALESNQITLEDYEQYANDAAVSSSYYTETAALEKTDNFQPVETSSSNAMGEASSNSNSDATAGAERNGGPDGAIPGGGNGGLGNMVNGDFSLVGFSSDQALAAAQNGAFTMVDGKAFNYTSSDDNDVIISENLATFNNVKVGDTITVANATDSAKTYKFKVLGIYKNTTDSQSFGGPMRSTASDPDNAIYTSTATVNALGLASDNTVTTETSSGNEVKTAASQLQFTYVFADKAAYDEFCNSIASQLPEGYTVQSADVDQYEQSLVPLNNLAKFAKTLLIVVLAVGAVIIVVLTIFNIRERKYEIGVLTAIGVRKGKVAAQFTTELLIVTMLGLIVGTGIGAAVCKPVSNEMLSSQITQQQTQAQSQREQFGRDMMQPGGGPGGGPDSASGEQNDEQRGSDSPTANSSAPDVPNEKRGMNRMANYVADVNATVNLKVIGIMMLIGLALTLVAALVAAVFVMRYEPLQILADRS
ncbi:ABC transporter permease [Bifidobacterium dolichotidis]|uniref:ABC transporter permease n=1 Tax=Bifidobacterium dolichotidis TaxID=2306976 RepID=A0A430FKC3_9BIFI|nr:ABC transporter permease [Bifidobacterium dolichotidis]RSX53354.1 ABC transporter permease [Bifidobacterium dolichotidis]